jgi:hypothetical protein
MPSSKRPVCPLCAGTEPMKVRDFWTSGGFLTDRAQRLKFTVYRCPCGVTFSLPAKGVVECQADAAAQRAIDLATKGNDDDA